VFHGNFNKMTFTLPCGRNEGDPGQVKIGEQSLHFEKFGDVRIFRPSQFGEDFIRRRSRAHLFSRFSAGTYSGRDEVNAIIQHQFKFYESLLAIFIPKLISRDAAEFLLFQFDEAVRILHGDGVLDFHERARWKETEPSFKRAIKYLIELICMQASCTVPKVTDDEAVFAMESALICAECMVSLAQQSDLAHSVFPDDCELRVFDDGPLDFKIALGGQPAGYDEKFSDRVIRDRENRNRFIKWPQIDYHTPTHQQYLDDAFNRSFGMTYGEFIAAITSVIDGSRPSLHPRSFPTLFIRRVDALNALSESGRCRSAIERAIDGFTVSPVSMAAEGRVVWKPKQKSRAYRRGFFLFPHESGPHLAFSSAMARENLIQLVNWIPYQNLPGEWESPMTRNAVGELANASGAWFEKTVSENLRGLGIVGQRAHRTIGVGSKIIRIPNEVGEIDFLGYHPQQAILVAVEAKMVMTGLEPCYWRDDLDTFVYRTGSYAERFRRKLAWVRENRQRIADVLGAKSPVKIAFAMFTLYPCIARGFIQDFECVSLAEFMLDFQRKSAWPYPLA
jgi:hypothetical protein